jgi:CDP-paratose synthetase
MTPSNPSRAGAERRALLITGVGGFLGTHLARRLSSRYEILGLEHSAEAARHVNRAWCPNLYFSSARALGDIFATHGIQAVLHAATLYNRAGESTARMLEANIVLPVELLELSNHHNVPLFINTDSFFNPAGNSDSIFNQTANTFPYLAEYTLSKRHCRDWLYLLTGPCRAVNLRVHHMYGPDDSPSKFVPGLLGRLLQNEERIALSAGDQTRDMVYVDDVVDAFETILNCQEALAPRYSSFDVGTGIGTTVRSLVTALKELSGSSSVLDFGALPYRANEIMHSVADPSALRALGWEPKVSLRDGLGRLVAAAGQSRQ